MQKMFSNRKIFSAKQFILMQLPGGVAALATLSNPTEASCTFHVKKKNGKFSSKTTSVLQGGYETHQLHCLHRIMESLDAWVGRNLQDPPVPIPCHGVRFGNSFELFKSIFYFQKQLKERADPLTPVSKAEILKNNFCPS